MTEVWPWITLALLGAYHGVNPAMGWLFAVALGLQEQSRQAMLRAFTPIVLGHAIAVALVVGLAGAAQLVVEASWLRMASGAVLLLFGLYKLVRNSHPRWVGMRVGFGDLTAWSFLMATAHGAGLMLAPVVFKLDVSEAAHTAHHAHAAPVTMAGMWAFNTGLLAVGLHTLAMFAVMALVAVVVYEKVGLRLLRRAWLNLDLVWAGALLLAGAATLFLG